MTIKREEAKELLPIIQAFADGKHIQWRNHCKNWIDIDERDGLNTEFPLSVYRIKPEPKYRPFKSQEEYWNEMLKHQPFGSLKSKDNEYFCLIGSVNKDVTITLAIEQHTDYPCTYLFEHYIFSDGTPFGIEEEKDNRIN